MKKNKKDVIIVVVCLIICVAIAVIPLLTIHDSEFGGADGAAEDAVGVVDPTYVPWFEPIIELPGGETESLLFCLQAAIGSGAFFFCFGYLVARKKFQSIEKEESKI